MSRKISEFGMVRAAIVAPELRVADVVFNADAVARALAELGADGVQFAVFPELCLTGYTCGDLFYDVRLREAALEGLNTVVAAAARADVSCVVGLPLEIGSRLYNCAALVTPDGVAGVVPKTCLPNTGEFYEERWFARSATLGVAEVVLGGKRVPAGTDLIFACEAQPAVRIGIEICEDLWGAEPLSGPLATAGATVIVNPSASNEILGKRGYRADLVRQQSARCLAAYLYASAGPGESSTDVVYSGHGLIAEGGVVLAETERFCFQTASAVADIDLEKVTNDRLLNSTFSASSSAGAWRRIPVRLGSADRAVTPLRRRVKPHPFIPDDPGRRAENCREIFSIQAAGLAARIRHTGLHSAVIGVSGGLDSTLALLVAIQAFRILGMESHGVCAVVMPGPGSTERTQTNAERLAKALGSTCRVIPIGPAVEQHLKDIGHPPDQHDTTYENAQARERTQILMDVANQARGLVVGTGDLSELALGWCTYNGDQMSMYHVNAGVPKTLVRHLIEWCAEEEFEGEVSKLLHDICATPITPELLPLGPDNSLLQKTEEMVGPYELNDFFLFQAVRNHFRPAKVFGLAREAFGEAYAPEEIQRYLHAFYVRFFANQFKRSAMPDGPKVGTVALSPRGDWRMPSDASPAVWLAECEACLGREDERSGT